MPNQSPLRSLIASRLTLLGCLLMTFGLLMSSIRDGITFVQEYDISSPFAQELFAILESVPKQLELVKENYSIVIAIAVGWSVLLSTAITGLPAIGLWMLYSNAKSRKPMKVTGFSLIHFFTLLQFIFACLNVFSGLLEFFGDAAFTETIANFLELVLQLALLFFALQYLKSAKNLLHAGMIIPINSILPLLILVSLLVSVGNVALILLANLVPSLTGKMSEYVLGDSTQFALTIAAALFTLGELAVFYFLSKRAIPALQAPDSSIEI